MADVYRTKLWQVTLPTGWRARESGPLVTLWNPSGVGTVNVLSNIESKAPSPACNGREFAGKLTGLTFEHTATDLFSRHWFLLCGEKWIHVHYFCATKNAALERAEVDEILQSIAEPV
jgi:hypothetical protein